MKKKYNPWWNTNTPLWKLEKLTCDNAPEAPVYWRVVSRIGNRHGAPMFTRWAAVWNWFWTTFLWRSNCPLFKVYRNQDGWRAYSILKQKGHPGPWGKTRRAAVWQWLKMPRKKP